MKLSKSVLFLFFLLLVVDFGSRLVGVHKYLFRPREGAVMHPDSVGCFQKNFHLTIDRSYGDLSSMGNMSDVRVYRREEFHSDACGNRNVPSLLERRSDVVLWGDSFFAGDGNSDENILSVQLEKALGAPVYNGASVGPQFMRALFHRLKQRQGWLVVDLLERLDYGDPGKSLSLDEEDVCVNVPAEIAKQRSKDDLKTTLAISPAKVWGLGLLKKLQNDQILPNPYKQNVFRRQLRGGEMFLFLGWEGPRKGEAEGALKYARWMQDEAAKEGVRTLIVLIPNKYTVYSPLFKELPQPGFARGGTYLQNIERLLVAAGIPVLNLTEIMRKHAAEAYAAGRFIYWPDDTHWNPEGIFYAAQSIADRLKQFKDLKYDQPQR